MNWPRSVAISKLWGFKISELVVLNLVVFPTVIGFVTLSLLRLSIGCRFEPVAQVRLCSYGT